MTSAYDYSKQYQYDANGNCTYFADSYGWEKCTYDEANNRIYHETAYGDKITYDTNGNLTYQTSQDSSWDKYTYDANGNMIQFESAYGDVTTYTYDAAGNLIEEQYRDSDGYERTTRYAIFEI